MNSDYELALRLSEEWNFDIINKEKEKEKTKTTTSVVDPSWELIDPVPDIRELFVEFNAAYFDGLLASVEVKWSARMTLCAGLCCYEGRGGLCSIKLSTPLLKLRPRKDLVETLLHEMIHALLFVTNNNKDHDGHGPEFHKHMYRINKQAGCNITVYHSFHDEVNSYRQHWWRCNGPCVKWSPYYGIVRRAMNRAPSERDPWWADHKRRCGGTYTKIKEPENYGKKKSNQNKDDKKEPVGPSSDHKSTNIGSKQITSFFKKTSQNDTSNSPKTGNVKWRKGGSGTNTITVKGSHTSTTSTSKTQDLSSLNKNNNNSSNVVGFNRMTGTGEQIFKASGDNASSNIHGFKMSARNKENQKTNTFQGKGFSLIDTKNVSKDRDFNNRTSHFDDVSSKREAFLKRLESKSNSSELKKRPNSNSSPLQKRPPDLNSSSLQRRPNSNSSSLQNRPNLNSSPLQKRPKLEENSNIENNIPNQRKCNEIQRIETICLDDSHNGDENFVQCPACPKLIKEIEMNDHLDTCLL